MVRVLPLLHGTDLSLRYQHVRAVRKLLTWRWCGPPALHLLSAAYGAKVVVGLFLRRFWVYPERMKDANAPYQRGGGSPLQTGPGLTKGSVE